MAITLGSVALDGESTAVREKLEEVGGKDARIVTLSGLIANESTADAIEAQLDAIVDAASELDYSAELSVRAGRRLFVRRATFSREISAEKLTGAFTLKLEARDAFEESVDETVLNWPVATSGATLAVSANGNVDSPAVYSLTAVGTVVNPAISDGERMIAYEGMILDGETLVLDGKLGLATLNGTDVTPYTTGVFPHIAPEGTTLTYTDDATSSHTATIDIAYRDRWW